KKTAAAASESPSGRKLVVPDAGGGSKGPGVEPQPARPPIPLSVRVAQASRRAAEVDVLGLDRPRRPPRRRLVCPIQVRVRDDLARRRRSPCRLVLRRVSVADKRRVVPPDERAVKRRADARIGLCAD